MAFFTEENGMQNAILNSVVLAIHIWNEIVFLLVSPEGTDDQTSIEMQT